MIKLYHYIHCPFCVRVRMSLGKLEIPFKSIVVPYDDEKTPLDLCQKKMLPIMEWENGSAQNESLDIIQKLDSKGLLNCSRLGESENLEELENTLNELGSLIHNLAMPYWIWTPEFNSSSRQYFQQKKEKKRGPFKDLFNKRFEFIEELRPKLDKLESKLDPYYLGNELSIFDIMLASHLWGLKVVPDFSFSSSIRNYLDLIERECSFNYHQDFEQYF